MYYVDYSQERNRYREEVARAREQMMQTEQIINQRVDQILLIEKTRMRDMMARIEQLEVELKV